MCIEKNVKLLPSLLLMLIMALLLTPLSINAQDSAKVVQFSGYVVTPDSLVGIPFVTIRVEGKNRGSYSNADGYFSFAAAAGDTVMFSCFGFQDDQYVIPSTLSSNKYSIVKLMTEDYAYLDSVIIYPWPTREMFRAAFWLEPKASRSIFEEYGAGVSPGNGRSPSYGRSGECRAVSSI